MICMAMAASSALAQTTEDYLSRYNALVNRVGVSGLGVDLLLTRWEKADPVDINHMIARGSYHLYRARKDSVVAYHKAAFMGMEPILTTKDSLGRNTYFYSVPNYQPEEFALAMEALDNALVHDNTRLDLMLSKADALKDFEYTTPDQCVDYIISIIDKHFGAKMVWTLPGGGHVTEEDFLEEMQNYCNIFFRTDSQASLEAFRKVSEAVLKYRPKSAPFIDNIGAYWASRKDDKKAMKYYKNALKADPDDAIAKQNIALIEKRAAAAKKK